MMRLTSAFDGHEIFIVTYDSESTKDLKNAYRIKYPMPSLGLLILRTLFEAIKILSKEKPDLIVSTGGGEIAIPFCYIGKLLGMKIIFIETLARVKTPSGGGHIVYPIADLFLVQWESLLKEYGNKAKYWGNLI